tara:strand:- start:3268 stop:4335 length:1068 start_codon:yes stop_codon:yes gene_type:complete
MAQNVGTPRFYVSVLQWLDAMGLLQSDATSFMTEKTAKALVHINPTSQAILHGVGGDTGWGEKHIKYTLLYNSYDRIMPNDKNFTMVLGHNWATSHIDSDTSFIHTFSGSVADETLDIPYGDHYIGGSATAGYVNYSHGTCTGNGFYIAHGNDAHNVTGAQVQMRFQYPEDGYKYKIGSILYGTYYDMSHSPDLSLKMSVEMDGVKNIQTKGGSTLSNASYTKPANWGDLGAWQIGGAPAWNFRHGRRSWDLSFSYLSDTDIMPKVAAHSNILSGENAVNDAIYSQRNTLRTDSDFFSVVWNRTMGGHLPFVFQPNGDNNSPDQFCIARFDQSSLQYEQVANNVYNVKLKIRECW